MESRIFVAPMMDWTDRHCRYFHRLLAPSARLYTEMVTTGAILAQRIIPELESKDQPELGHDSSTNNLIRRYRRLKEVAP
jgi:tRNA-dihydrouridine synthase